MVTLWACAASRRLSDYAPRPVQPGGGLFVVYGLRHLANVHMNFVGDLRAKPIFSATRGPRSGALLSVRVQSRSPNPSPSDHSGGLLLFHGVRHIHHMWTHRPTIIGGQTAPDDRTVYFDGRAVGRVYFAVNMWPPRQWVWTCGSAHGRSETMAEALEAVRNSLQRKA